MLKIRGIPAAAWTFLAALDVQVPGASWNIGKNGHRARLTVNFPVENLCKLNSVPCDVIHGGPTKINTEPGNVQQKKLKKKTPSQRKRDKARLEAWKQRRQSNISLETVQPVTVEAEATSVTVTPETTDSANCSGLPKATNVVFLGEPDVTTRDCRLSACSRRPRDHVYGKDSCSSSGCGDVFLMWCWREWRYQTEGMQQMPHRPVLLQRLPN